MRQRAIYTLAALFAFATLLGSCANPAAPAVDRQDDGPGDVQRDTLIINFDDSSPGCVNGPYDGSGIAGDPAPGQLDADAWQFVGFSDGDSAYGADAATGDFARGVSVGGETVGGLYGFEVEAGNVALGIQPTSTDFAPGSVTLRIGVSHSAPATLDLAYTAWDLNNADRSSAWSVAVSTDDTTWITIDELRSVGTEVADADPLWTGTALVGSLVLNAPEISSGDFIQVRWTLDDASGSGSRDETAIDDVHVTVSY